MNSNDTLIIENAQIVLPDRVIERGSVKIEDGIIAEIREGSFNSIKKKIDAKGFLLIPGFVDIHSDALEKEIEPRPNVVFPIDIATVELDKKLAACGITTVYHSISFAEGEIGLRCNRIASKIVDEINRLRDSLTTRAMIHCRFEITNTEAIPLIENFLREGKVNLLSFMDHTPGQGQFRDVVSYMNYFGKVYKKSNQELTAIIDRKLALRSQAQENILYLASLCNKLNIPLASHDDDSEEKVNFIKKLNVKISEFPVNKEAAKAAIKMGINVCVGAPNALRGGSQVKNLSAREAISEGLANIICSDYSPMTILHGIFILNELKIKPLHELVNMATLYPAKAVGVGEFVGSIEIGKQADLILISYTQGIKRIVKTFKKGKEIFSCPVY